MYNFKQSDVNYFEKYRKKNSLLISIPFRGYGCFLCLCVCVSRQLVVHASDWEFFSAFFYFSILKRDIVFIIIIIILLYLPSKWYHFHPLPHAHTYHFLCLWPKDGEGKKSIQNIRPNVLLLLALIYSHSIFVWMDFSYFFFSSLLFFCCCWCWVYWFFFHKNTEKKRIVDISIRLPSFMRIA